MPLIMYAERASESPSALHNVRHVRLHSQEDSKAAFDTLWKQFGIMGAGGIVAAGLLPAENAAETIKWGAVAGLASASAYLAQGVAEARQKLDYLRSNFSKASHNFKDFETALTRPVREALAAPTDTFTDAFSIKKYPIRMTLAGLFSAGAMLPDDPVGKVAFLYMAALSVFNGIMINTEENITHINEAATKSKEMLEFIRDNRLSNPQKLDGIDLS